VGSTGGAVASRGRGLWPANEVIEYAPANIKPIDGVIAGKFPVRRDRVQDNAAYSRKCGVRG